MAQSFRFRRGTAAEWATANPTLAAGEPGYETDTGDLRIGDGATAWAELTSQGNPFGSATTSMVGRAELTPGLRLQGAIDAVEAAGGGNVLMPDAFTIAGGEEITVPPGVYLKSAGKKRTRITYSGTGWAITFEGDNTLNYRDGGGCDPISLTISAEGGKGVRIVDGRDLSIDVSVNGGTNLDRKCDVGVGLYYGTFDLGCSWNRVRVRNDYCKKGLELDGSAFSPAWVTRNRLSGHVQSCDTGVYMKGANTNQMQDLHPQDCTVGWDLVDSDNNDIRTIVENCTTDVRVDSDSVRNVFEGSIPGTITDNGWYTIFRTHTLRRDVPEGFYVAKASDTTRNNTASRTADPELTLSVLANRTYKVECFLVYDAATTADLSIGWSVPSGAVFKWTADALRTAAATASDQISRNALNTASSVSIGGAGAGTEVVALVQGVLIVGSAGSLTLNWAQATAEASDAVVRTRSFLRLTRIA